MAREVQEFFVVWCPQGGNPSVRHRLPEDARAEAKRLAEKAPGNDFFVLRSVGGYYMPKPGPEEIVIDDGFPF